MLEGTIAVLAPAIVRAVRGATQALRVARYTDVGTSHDSRGSIDSVMHPPVVDARVCMGCTACT